MTLLTTGLIENPAVSGVRPSSTLSVLISNDDTTSATIQIEGFFQSGTTKVKYVEELFLLAAGTMAKKNYDVPFDAFEFRFTLSSEAVNVSAWGKDTAGSLTAAQRVVAEEINPI